MRQDFPTFCARWAKLLEATFPNLVTVTVVFTLQFAHWNPWATGAERERVLEVIRAGPIIILPDQTASRRAQIARDAEAKPEGRETLVPQAHSWMETVFRHDSCVVPKWPKIRFEGRKVDEQAVVEAWKRF